MLNIFNKQSVFDVFVVTKNIAITILLQTLCLINRLCSTVVGINLQWKNCKDSVKFLILGIFSPKHCGSYKYRKKTLFEVNIVHYL